MVEPIVTLQQVHKTFPVGETAVQALRGIDLTVLPGEFMAISGASGSGKSTLLNLIGGLERCDSGTIRILGVELASLSDSERADWRARHLGFIFQTFNLLPVLTVYENVEYPLLLSKLPESQRRERINSLLQIVGLDKFRNHRATQLSGGQRQRVAIARALANQPTVVLADEPTANLDHKTGMDIIRLLQELNKTMRVTFFLSTHDPLILDQVGRIIELRDGQLIRDSGCSSN